MPTLAEMFPAYGISSQPLIGGLGGLGGPGTVAGLPIGALATLVAQQGATAPPSGPPGPPGAPSLASLFSSTTPPPGGGGGTDIERAMRAISAIESGSQGGNYGLMGPITRSGDRAYGRYQVMGANIGPWTLRHYGRALTPEQFLADTAAQDAVFRGQFGSYLTRFGNPADAASMWFTGRPYASGHTRSDRIPGVHSGLTGSQYVARFLAGF